MKQKNTVERKTMPVKKSRKVEEIMSRLEKRWGDRVLHEQMFVKGDGKKVGIAWVETVTYAEPRLVKTEWYEKGADGIIRKKERFDLMNGHVTGECPECKQMPCPHTAKLLGWPS